MAALKGNSARHRGRICGEKRSEIGLKGSHAHMLTTPNDIVIPLIGVFRREVCLLEIEKRIDDDR